MSKETVTGSRVILSRSRERAGIRNGLDSREERAAFVSSQIRMGIPFQLRANRLARGMTQSDLAKLIGTKQAAISRLESDSDHTPNVTTLQKIAEALDIGLVVRFVPFGELIEWVSGMRNRDLFIPSFNEEPQYVQASETTVYLDEDCSSIEPELDAEEPVNLANFRSRQFASTHSTEPILTSATGSTNG